MSAAPFQTDRERMPSPLLRRNRAIAHAFSRSYRPAGLSRPLLIGECCARLALVMQTASFGLSHCECGGPFSLPARPVSNNAFNLQTGRAGRTLPRLAVGLSRTATSHRIGITGGEPSTHPMTDAGLLCPQPLDKDHRIVSLSRITRSVEAAKTHASARLRSFLHASTSSLVQSSSSAPGFSSKIQRISSSTKRLASSNSRWNRTLRDRPLCCSSRVFLATRVEPFHDIN